MFRNQYDTDVTTWSPQGRLHQVEYAMEAVKQGAACVGLRSADYAVLAAVKRAPSDLSSHQKKLFEIDEHVGIAISGLTADARQLCKQMRNECLEHRYVYEAPLLLSRLVLYVANTCQSCTQRSSARPYGVGLIVAGYDSLGPHIYQTCPSGNYYEYKAITIGAKSQSAKTYLEKTYEAYATCSKDELVKHAVAALKESAQSDGLTAKNLSIGIVGKDCAFHVLDDEHVQPYLDMLDSDEVAEPTAAAVASMDESS